MKCTKARELLSDRHNGELAPRGAEGLARHLEGCAACRQAARELDEMLALLGTVSPPPLPPGFGEALHDRLVAEGRDVPTEAAPEAAVSRSLWGRALRGAALAAAGAAAAVLVMWASGLPGATMTVSLPAPEQAAHAASTSPKAVTPQPDPARRLRVGQMAVLVMSIQARDHHPDARLQVVLPDGVSLLGEGATDLEEKRVEWTATLNRGANEIRIPVRARRPGTWRLVARARAAGFRSTSEARLVVTRS